MTPGSELMSARGVQPVVMSPNSGSQRARSKEANSIEAQIRRKVEQLSYLPGSAAVAIKFIEIGRDPEAGASDYDKIISADAALSTKLLALANSSWFATRNKVDKVVHAISLLGINNVRTLAISYCMTGVHTRLKTPKEYLDRYWQASLCKGVAAREFARAFDPSLADQAFMSGLLQDMAIPVMHAVAAEQVGTIMQDRRLSIEAQLDTERDLLGTDHPEVGRQLATKLELPELYVDSIAFHHDGARIQKFCESSVLGDAVLVAGQFPHITGQWHERDIDLLKRIITERACESFPTFDAFLQTVQSEFESLFAFFEPGETSQMKLGGLIAEACEELADATTLMMGQMNTLMVEAAKMGATVSQLTAAHEELAHERRRDSLTGVLNRAGFLEEGQKCVQQAERYSTPFAVMYFDVDKFKSTNDAYGHHYGDFVLREISARVSAQLRDGDVIGRIGGDEFVILLNDITADDVREVSDAIMKVVRNEPYAKGKVAEQKTISLGALFVSSDMLEADMTTLISEADALMYMAKRAGPGQVRMRTFSGATAL